MEDLIVSTSDAEPLDHRSIGNWQHIAPKSAALVDSALRDA
jgi:hypothetical protein